MRCPFGLTAFALALPLVGGCVSQPPPTAAPVAELHRGGATLIGPRCVEVDSCLMGRVVAAETADPIPHASVFLRREGGSSEDPGEVIAVRLTDDQGVFTIQNPEAGRYRLAVYKQDRSFELRGFDLGAPGTVWVPIRLPPS